MTTGKTFVRGVRFDSEIKKELPDFSIFLKNGKPDYDISGFEGSTLNEEKKFIYFDEIVKKQLLRTKREELIKRLTENPDFFKTKFLFEISESDLEKVINELFETGVILRRDYLTNPQKNNLHSAIHFSKLTNEIKIKWKVLAIRLIDHANRKFLIR